MAYISPTPTPPSAPPFLPYTATPLSHSKKKKKKEKEKKIDK